MKLLLREKYGAYDLTGKPSASREKGYSKIFQTQMGQLCCSCLFSVELSGERNKVSLFHKWIDRC